MYILLIFHLPNLPSFSLYHRANRRLDGRLQVYNVSVLTSIYIQRDNTYTVSIWNKSIVSKLHMFTSCKHAFLDEDIMPHFERNRIENYVK